MEPEEKSEWMDDMEAEHQNELSRADEEEDELKLEILTGLYNEELELPY